MKIESVSINLKSIPISLEFPNCSLFQSEFLPWNCNISAWNLTVYTSNLTVFTFRCGCFSLKWGYFCLKDCFCFQVGIWQFFCPKLDYFTLKFFAWLLLLEIWLLFLIRLFSKKKWVFFYPFSENWVLNLTPWNSPIIGLNNNHCFFCPFLAILSWNLTILG